MGSGGRTSTSLSNISRPSSSPRWRFSAVWLARFVGALTIAIRSPLRTRFASVCPYVCACHVPSGVRPDSVEYPCVSP